MKPLDLKFMMAVGLLIFLLKLQLKKKTLEVTVWDYDRFSSNDFLGEVSVFPSLCSDLIES